MVQWKKKKAVQDQEIDFESLEELFEDLLETFDEEEIDFSKPLKIGFSVSLNGNGSLQVDEFGLLKEKKKEAKQEPILVELMEFANEFLIVVETNSFSTREIDIKALDHALIISNHKSKNFLKKVSFPCKVKQDSIKTALNNGVLEIRLTKKSFKKNIMKS